MGYAPHHLASQGASPPRGSREAADNFCLIVRKHDEARGSLDARQGFTFLPKKILQAKFYVGKGKPWNKADNFMQARGRLGRMGKF